jgi:ligand-binding SRPBCC domain-containing protein
MHLKLTTLVTQNYQQVAANFDEKLFKALNPPFPPVKLLRFDGSRTGDEVHLELNFLLFKQVWKSLIIEDSIQEGEIYFIDKGIQLPFFLRYWQHTHRILKQAEHTAIIDDIQFRTPFILFDYLMYPVLYGQFFYRKPVYKKYFQRKQ